MGPTNITAHLDPTAQELLLSPARPAGSSPVPSAVQKPSPPVGFLPVDQPWPWGDLSGWCWMPRSSWSPPPPAWEGSVVPGMPRRRWRCGPGRRRCCGGCATPISAWQFATQRAC
uniref:Uncharacterized protein n=1 Tax=Arundo donax TaxID=35708 RepID=A0A0A9E6V1_ARUDO